MDLAKIKKFMLSRGDRLVFMENGEPDMVMMSFSEYEKLARGTQLNGGMARILLEEKRFDSLIKPEEWADEDPPETELMADDPPASMESPRLDQIRLEDLPL
jgi:PHD/YefM family antitoxin component YafN of YafNO toxin-antitoxin module